MRGLTHSLLLVLPLLCQTGRAQASEAETVVFFTPDQVELAGTFYPSSRGSAAPCALLLHQIGGSRQDPGWRQLAFALQKRGFAVLSFDFRGHGESTNVASDFWLFPANRGMKSANTQAQKLSCEDFTRTAHYASLVNDVATAKRVLDLKSREGGCDSSAVVVLGAESGATIGALWIAAEWQRFRTTKDAGGKPIRQGQEGHDIACAVWLSISPCLHGRQAIPLDNWLGSPVRERVPMAFLYGANDVRGRESANGLYEKLRLGAKDSMNRLTGVKGIDGADQSGSELAANDSLRVGEFVVNYLDKVMMERKKVVRVRANLEIPPPLVALEQFGVR